MTNTPQGMNRNVPSLAGLIKSLMSQILATGLESISKIQHEGGKLIESYIKQQGESTAALKTPSTKADRVKIDSANDFAHLEKIFEGRVSRVLQRLNVPTQQDLENINKRIDSLQKSLGQMIEKKT